jgi:hypothetical protein
MSFFPKSKCSSEVDRKCSFCQNAHGALGSFLLYLRRAGIPVDDGYLGHLTSSTVLDVVILTDGVHWR